MRMRAAKEAAKRIADKYAVGSLRDDLQYEIEAEINIAVSRVMGIPPGPAEPPGTPPLRVA